MLLACNRANEVFIISETKMQAAIQTVEVY